MIRPLLLLAAGVLLAQTAPPTLLSEPFSYADGLHTNEWAFSNPAAPGGRHSAVWDVTSGSLFASGGRGWTGVPDAGNPGPASATNTGSAVFRAVTRERDFLDVTLTFKLLNRGLTATASTPATAWDGCHIFLRYQSEYSLYYASINRRDNTVVIKKKVPGGPSNGGTYYNISPTRPYAVPTNVWQDVKAVIANEPDGSVSISLYAGGVLLVGARDDGSVGGGPIRGGGGLGFRGDNADLQFDDVLVTGTRGAMIPPAPGAPGSPAVADALARAPQKFLSPGLADGVNDEARFGPAAASVTVYSVLGRKVFDAEGGAALAWNGRDETGRVVASGVYIARIRKTDGTFCYQSFAVAR